MANTLSEATWNPILRLLYNVTTSQNNKIPDVLVTNAAGFAALQKTLTNGTGSNKAQTRFWHRYTTAPSTNNDLDLQTLVDDFGTTNTFTKIKWFLLRVVTPVTGQNLTIGNYGANGFTGWFGGTGHTEDVFDQSWKVNQIDGWTVDATHRYLRIRNAAAANMTYDIVLIGE